jgi:hypothetical protein
MQLLMYWLYNSEDVPSFKSDNVYLTGGHSESRPRSQSSSQDFTAGVECSGDVVVRSTFVEHRQNGRQFEGKSVPLPQQPGPGTLR